MTKPKPAPAYLIVASDEERRAVWRERLTKHGLVRICADRASAVAEAESAKRSWAGFVVDLGGYTRNVARLVRELHRASPGTPGLVVHAGAPPEDDLRAIEFRVATDDDVVETRAFLGRGLARTVTDDPYVLDAVESLGRVRGLTPKQTELLALSTAPLDRTSVVETLGVSNNTLKTRVRQLLKIFGMDSMDALGKSVLRAALDRAREEALAARKSPTKSKKPAKRAAKTRR